MTPSQYPRTEGEKRRYLAPKYSAQPSVLAPPGSTLCAGTNTKSVLVSSCQLNHTLAKDQQATCHTATTGWGTPHSGYRCRRTGDEDGTRLYQESTDAPIETFFVLERERRASGSMTLVKPKARSRVALTISGRTGARGSRGTGLRVTKNGSIPTRRSAQYSGRTIGAFLRLNRPLTRLSDGTGDRHIVFRPRQATPRPLSCFKRPLGR